IKACKWIRENLPFANLSGGISNLSFAFRGNHTIRNAMNSVFLHHAVRAGINMAIVNPVKKLYISTEIKMK
ncbi:MAG: dihydropteroate synthase, partial [Bacteroidales bacterium]